MALNIFRKNNVLYMGSVLSIGGVLFIVGTFINETGIAEGHWEGRRATLAIQEVNDNEEVIGREARLLNLNPRVLGAAIYAERTINYTPVLENVVSFFFGVSVGFAQINLPALITQLRMLEAPTSMDSLVYINGRENEFEAMKGRYRFLCRLKLWQIKYRLAIDDELNISCAALILKLSTLRYRMSPHGFDVTNNCSVSATLYHIRFPVIITGKPDSFGVFAEKAYKNPAFMPHFAQ